ncbi:MAG: glycosyltransferase [Alicyclobacillaceae bacterium]|nr:glycosyltransferase [Alicyclobacillaceae bacterium]
MSVVLAALALNEDVVRQVRELVQRQAEVVVICEGDDAGTVLEGAEGQVIRVPEHAGYDVAFAIGATYATGDTLIFSDAGLGVAPDVLLEFAAPIRSGAADFVLNNQNPYQAPLKSMHPVHIGTWFANITAGRRDLGISSLLVPPYAIRRDALQVLGPELLMSPCLAQMRAVVAQLRLHLGPSIPVVTSAGGASESRLFHKERVLGDVLEGLYDWIARHGIRGGFTDEGRHREVVPAREGVYLAQFGSNFVPVDAEESWLFG